MKDSALHLNKLEVSTEFESGPYLSFVDVVGFQSRGLIRIVQLPGSTVTAARVAKALNALDAWERLVSSPAPSARACKCHVCKKHISDPEEITPVARITALCRACAKKGK